MSSNTPPPPPPRRINSSGSHSHKRGSSSSLKRLPSSENGSANTSKPTSPISSTNGDRTVKRLRLSRALTIPEGTTVSDACRRMASRRVDAVLLTDSNALLSGIVTDKDVATRVIAEDLKPEETLISTIMTRNPTFVSADALAIEALQKMVQGKFRHLPVVDNGEVIAMLDITKCLYDAISKMEKAAEQGSVIAAAVEGVERQYGSSFSAPQVLMETLKERMFKPALSSIIDDSSKLAIVSPTDTVQAAAKIMQELRTNCVIVVSGSKIQGMLTSRDILMKVLAANMSPESTLAEKVMTPNPDCAKLDTTILEALHIMHDGKFLHIPVLDKDGSIAACIDVLQLTHAAISMVENSSGALNNVTNVMMQKFWDSALASEQGDDYDTQSEMSMMLATEAAELGKSSSPRLGNSFSPRLGNSSSPRLGNSFSYKFEDQKGRVHRFDVDVFNGQNFGEWQISMKIALSSKNKMGFVNGVFPRPEKGHQHFDRWTRCNDMVRSWLLNGLDKQIRRSVIYTETAQGIWEQLGVRFGQMNGAQLYEVRKKLHSLTQGSDSISTYHTKIISYWDELGSLKKYPLCTCGSVNDFMKIEADERLVDFLMGLNEVYTTVRGSILMMKELPSVDCAYALLLQEEKQREMQVGSSFKQESASMNVIANKGSKSGEAPFKYPGSSGQKRGVYTGEKKQLFCTNCKKTNHTIERCFFLNGFPENYKGKNKIQGGENRFAGSVETTNGQRGVELTQEQITNLSKLLSMLDTSSARQRDDAPDDFAGFAGSVYEDTSGDW